MLELLSGAVFEVQVIATLGRTWSVWRWKLASGRMAVGHRMAFVGMLAAGLEAQRCLDSKGFRRWVESST
jgi:hypothetical protein